MKGDDEEMELICCATCTSFGVDDNGGYCSISKNRITNSVADIDCADWRDYFE